MAQVEIQEPPDFELAPPSEFKVDKGRKVEIISEEVVEAGNATMTVAENQTADGNMTGTNSSG